MALSRKHFEHMAKAINATLKLPNGHKQTAEFIADAFADMVERENGGFDRNRFFHACGLKD